MLKTTGGAPPAAPAATARLDYIDSIKGLVVAGVIVAHAAMTYGAVGSWPYQEALLTSVPTLAGLALAAVASLGMGVLLLVAGMLTPPGLDAHGRRRFLLDRMRRLGLPILAYLLLVIPALNFVGRWAQGWPRSEAAAYALGRIGQLDVGAAWFLLVLLLITFAYIGWRAWDLPPLAARGLRARHLLALAFLMASGSFVVRIFQPIDSPAPINVAAWPGFAALFALGVAGFRARWLSEVPFALAQTGLAMAVAGTAGLAALVLVARPPLADLVGGVSWAAAGTAAGEALFAIGLPVWVFWLFQRLAPAPLGRYTRSSFGAYLLQAPVLVLVAVAMRPLPLPGPAKLVLLAGLALLLCFGLAAGQRGERRHGQGRHGVRAAPARP